MPTYNKRQLLKKKYLQYNKSFVSWYEAKIFAEKIKKYRYFSHYIEDDGKYYVYYKKKNYLNREFSRVWKEEKYNDNYIHYYAGFENKRRDFEKISKIHNFKYEWNMFLIKEDSGVWNLFFSYYDIVFGKPKKFSSYHKILTYVSSLT